MIRLFLLSMFTFTLLITLGAFNSINVTAGLEPVNLANNFVVDWIETDNLNYEVK